ncbi:MAG: HxsD-like protein [Bacilli bacterium]|nr:HxsD-like protein [Candidatus Paceibacterota bacterium]MDD4411704.1 HxsD-like protein [Bacilli bacterium]
MEIKFDKNIYNKKALENTIQAYKELANIEFSEVDNFYIVAMSNVDEEVKDLIGDEFCNYLLFETVKCL